MAKPRVGLFVTCLVDLYRPVVGFAAIKLLEDAGCTVEVPEAQTCCGQPGYNSGDKATAEHHGLQARIASWRTDAQAEKSSIPASTPSDPDLELAKLGRVPVPADRVATRPVPEGVGADLEGHA